ncbi:MAG TPA: exosome complex exonuclease Rrp41 [Methanomassiliicoccales archaeon]|nr:exosome complex exonuclease Rrp41 [Methanomassiliicoccales archaeon]HXZ23550.1 exosome complex exonuclease Rrp41 [Methanomassiliicoccales archaeon]
MGGTSNVKLIDDNGIRVDGRTLDELRPIKIEAGVLKRADGSAYVEFGKNKVLAAVYGPRECHPRHMQDPSKAIVQCKYNMIAFSVNDRKRPGPDRRSVEISKIISEALEYVVFTENFPRTSIDVYIEVLQANAGTRCAGLTAASVALADAGIPMKDLVPAVAVGKVNDQVVLDLQKEEDNFGQADLPIAMIPRTGEVLLMQMDGHMTMDEFDRAIELGVGACKKIYDLQKDALQRRYSVEQPVGEEPEEPAPAPQTEG